MSQQSNEPKEFNVNVISTTSKEKQDAEKYNRILRELQDQLYKNYKDDNVYTYDDLNELTKDYLMDESPKSTSTGIVSITPNGKPTSNFLRQSFNDKQKMILSLKREAELGNREAVQALDELWSKPSDLTGLQNIKLNLDNAPKELKEDHTWYDYTRYLQGQSKGGAK